MKRAKCNNDATAFYYESNSRPFNIAMIEYLHIGNQKTKLKLGSMI